MKSIDGAVITWPSSTIAKCCCAASLVTPGSCASWPRWAISLVTRWKTLLPCEVKPKFTSGVPDSLSEPSAGFLMSEPVSTGSSLSTYQLFGEACVTLPFAPSTGRACTTIVPGFTRTAFGVAPFGGL